MDLARGHGIDIIERAIMPEELSKAAEIFVTGTAAEVTPVSQIDDMKFTVGPITKMLLADYDQLVREPLGSDASVA